MTSDAFQEFRKVEVAKEQLMMSVKGPRITGRQSLMMRMLTLSGPGDLLEGIDDTIRSTCVQVTGVKLNIVPRMSFWSLVVKLGLCLKY